MFLNKPCLGVSHNHTNTRPFPFYSPSPPTPPSPSPSFLGGAPASRCCCSLTQSRCVGAALAVSLSLFISLLGVSTLLSFEHSPFRCIHSASAGSESANPSVCARAWDQPGDNRGGNSSGTGGGLERVCPTSKRRTEDKRKKKRQELGFGRALEGPIVKEIVAIRLISANPQPSPCLDTTTRTTCMTTGSTARRNGQDGRRSRACCCPER